MAATLVRIELYVDPCCPFAWIAYQWLSEVRRHRAVELGLHLMSLPILNEHQSISPGYRRLLAHTWGPARVSTAAVEQHGQTSSRRSTWRSLAASSARPIITGDQQRARLGHHRCAVRGRTASPLADAAASDAYDGELRVSHDAAMAPMGSGVGTPIIHLGAGAFFGPVMTGVPRGSEALKVFDGLRLLASYPRLFEIKRPLAGSLERADARSALMDREQSWQVIAEQRLGLAHLLEGLSDAEWEQPSLCAGWRVRDVAAHVAPTGSRAGVDARRRDPGAGSFHRLNHDIAVRHAARPTRDIVAELRAYADSRRLPVVTNYRNIGFDVLVHTQDIAIPLGRDYPMPPRPRWPVPSVWTMGWPFWARRRLRGAAARHRHRLVRRCWGRLRGPIAMLLLLLTGRTATALPHLSGPGVQTISERLRAPRAEADQG